MLDWRRRIREYLDARELPAAMREEVVYELAAHLEESYEQARWRGLDEAAAAEAALNEVEDWRGLAADICRAKSEEGSMNYRTKSLWLPALTTLLGASVSLALMQFLGMRPHVVSIAGMGVTFYWPWLATLPIFGAMGAWLSRRGQGKRSACLVAGLSPAVLMLIVMVGLVLPFGLVIDGMDFIRLVGLGIALTMWVVIPGIALLVGALPFLWSGGRPVVSNSGIDQGLKPVL